MILTDREIETALHNNHITVDPMPDQRAFSSTTLDLRLANVFEEWIATPGMTITPGARDYSYDKLGHLRAKSTANAYRLEPGNFVLGWTIEEVSLPIQSRLAARVEGKSSLARLGVGIHVTAPIIHSGFSGNIQLEIYNNNKLPIELTYGMYVCQLVFEQTYGTAAKGYGGIFSGQKAQRN